jgi:hypothetical protein
MKRGQRDMLAKRLKRLRPENIPIVVPLVDELIERLISLGFSTEKNSRFEIPFVSHELWFERSHSEQAFEYIELGFADDGDLSFGLSCGVQGHNAPDDWHSYATLSKRRFGLWRTCDLGALYFSPFKEQAFMRDWRFLLRNLNEIIQFLETGKATDNLINVKVFDFFRPRGL